jgi:hypothetical protein
VFQCWGGVGNLDFGIGGGELFFETLSIEIYLGIAVV